MGGFTLASLLIPEEAYLVIFVASGLLIIIGLKRIAFALMGFVLISILLPPFLEPLLAELPDWVIWAILAFVALALLRAVLGRDVWANMWGTFLGNLLTDLVMGLIRLPVRIIRWLFGWMVPRRRN